MVPLSGALSLLKLRGFMFGGIDVGGDWSIRSPRSDYIRCSAVVAGQCWSAVAGVAEPVHPRTGDCFPLLAGDRLANCGEPIAVVALSLGYESESAFSTAFKRVIGSSPRRYGRGRNLVAASNQRGVAAGLASRPCRWPGEVTACWAGAVSWHHPFVPPAVLARMPAWMRAQPAPEFSQHATIGGRGTAVNGTTRLDAGAFRPSSRPRLRSAGRSPSDCRRTAATRSSGRCRRAGPPGPGPSSPPPSCSPRGCRGPSPR